MIREGVFALSCLAVLTSCSSPKPSSDNGQSNAANASTPTKSGHAFVFVGMMETDKIAVEATVEKLYARYRRSPDVDGGESDVGPAVDFARPLTELMTRWSAAQPEDEIDSILSDADWVCQCQDWTGSGFKFLEKTIKPIPGGQIEARLRFDLGDGVARQARILFSREARVWKIADLFSPDVPKGIVAQMTSDLARWEKK